MVLDVVAGGLVGQGLPLMREGGRWVIATTSALEQAAAAQEELGRRGHVGKIVLGVDQS